jgi:very-short-patch-repair endonuclease
MKKKKQTVEIEEVLKAFGEEPKKSQADNILVTDLKTLRQSLKLHKLNPMERVMATNLLAEGYEFYTQYRIDLSDGNTCNGRKYFIADFYIPEYGEEDFKFKVNIIVETDGKIHEEPGNIVKDRARDNFLTGMGYRVFHFTWEEVMATSESYDPLIHLDMLCSDIGYQETSKFIDGFKEAEKKFRKGAK